MSGANKFFITNSGEHLFMYNQVSYFKYIKITSTKNKISLAELEDNTIGLSIWWIIFYTFNKKVIL